MLFAIILKLKVLERAKVYIIIVHFNEVNDTLQCIKSLNKQSGLFEKILVVNNASKEINWNSLIEAKSEYLIFINSAQNNGYASACNLGLNYIRQTYEPDYFWLLNNDTEVAPDCLNKLLSCAENNKKSGLFGSKIFHLKNNEVLQGVAGVYNKLACITKHIGKGEKDTGQFTNENLKFDYPLGVSLFVRDQFVRDVGLLSEEYFLYFEELDWAFRSKLSKWETSICLDSKIYHKGGASTGAIKENRNAKSALSDFHAIRSRIIFTRKHIVKYVPFLYLFLGMLAIEMIYRGKTNRVKMIADILKNIKCSFIESRYS